MEDKIIENFTSKLSKELKTGVLSLLILNLIKAKKSPMYGYDIIKSLKAYSDERLNFQEGTVYPVLRMLKNQGFLSSHWENSPDGPPRKYYTLTERGNLAIEEANAQWYEISVVVNEVLEKLREKYDSKLAAK